MLNVEVVDATTLRATWALVPPTRAAMVGYKLLVTTPGHATPHRYFIKLDTDTEQVVTKLGEWMVLSDSLYQPRRCF